MGSHLARGPHAAAARSQTWASGWDSNRLYIKNDTVNPSFSFKDRVVAVAVAKARELGYETFACASTGNLAGAVAAAGARHGMDTYVFLPADIEAGQGARRGSLRRAHRGR